MPWVTRDDYLTYPEMENNALLVWGFFRARGWSLNAVSALLANMQGESSISPGRWEVGQTPFSTSAGYGLCAWTPYYQYSLWAGDGWYNNGTRQCEFLEYLKNNGYVDVVYNGETQRYLAWFDYYGVVNGQEVYIDAPISFEEFAVSNLPLHTLTDYFMWFFEHPGDPYVTTRHAYADYWYNFLTGKDPAPPDDDPSVPPSPSKKQKMPLWMYPPMQKRRF